MKNEIIAFGLVLFMVISMTMIGATLGYEHALEEVEARAMELPDPGYETDCYNWQDVEYVVFGESQE